MVDLSLNQTLGRTIVTSLTMLLVLFMLLFLGELIRGFFSSYYRSSNRNLFIHICCFRMLMSLTLTQEDLAVPEPEGADFDGMP